MQNIIFQIAFSHIQRYSINKSSTTSTFIPLFKKFSISYSILLYHFLSKYINMTCSSLKFNNSCHKQQNKTHIRIINRAPPS